MNRELEVSTFGGRVTRRQLSPGRCRECGCTEERACRIATCAGERSCGWSSQEKTLCDNPRCLAAARGSWGAQTAQFGHKTKENPWMRKAPRARLYGGLR